MMKRAFAVFAAVCLMMVMCLSVAAAPSIQFTVGTVTAKPGETVTVPLSISQVENIGAVAVHLYYDTQVLECLDAEIAGIMTQMDMSAANPTPQNVTGEVWLSGMCLNGVSGGGELMLITFKVKDNAPQGLTTVGFTGGYAPELITAEATPRALEYLMADGGVNVAASSATPNTAAPENTPVTNDATAAGGNDPQATVAPTDAPAATTAPVAAPTLANGETVKVSDETAVDVDGRVVTDAAGNPAKYPTVAIMLEEITADPGQIVTVAMSMSAVSGMTSMVIDVTYDTKALEFVEGSCVGFVQEFMNQHQVAERKEGIVAISGSDPEGVGGSGDMATLTFRVKGNADGGSYRLSMNKDIELLSNTVKLPVSLYAGEIHVTGQAPSIHSTWIIVVVIVAILAVVCVGLVLLARRKKVSPVSEAQTPPTQASADRTDVTDVGGEE